jgi:carbon monoxide dehydrogenase subunit G
MGSAISEIDIDKPADDVWAVVKDYGGLADWSPGIDECTLEGDERTLKMFGLEIVERRLSSDDAKRQLVYSVISGAGLTHHQATITVTLKDAGSHVTWAVDVEPDEMVGMLKGGYDGALKALKAHVGG